MGKSKSGSVERLAPLQVSRLAFGVRYEPQYGVMDRIGAVIDTVLRDEGTPFNPDFFPLSQTTPNEHVLFNPDTRNVLRITHQDTILQADVDTRQLSQIQAWADSFDEYVLQPLRTTAGLRQVLRYGVVHHLTGVRTLIKTLPTEHYLGKDFPGARTLSMRFTKRLPVEEAIVKKRVEDFKNVIYSLDESDDNNINVSLDYQLYFKPPLDAQEWTEKPFPEFVAKALEYFEGEFQTWFSKIASRAEVA